MGPATKAATPSKPVSLDSSAIVNLGHVHLIDSLDTRIEAGIDFDRDPYGQPYVKLAPYKNHLDWIIEYRGGNRSVIVSQTVGSNRRSV